MTIDWTRYTGRASQILTDLDTALASASSYTDPNLSSAGLQAKRADLAEDAREEARHAIAAIRRTFDYDYGAARAKSERTLHAATGNTRDEWDRVTTLLDAGKSLSQVIAEAGPERLHAINEWAPTMLEANAARKDSAAGGAFGTAYSSNRTDPVVYTEAVRHAVSRRWAEVTSDESMADTSSGYEAQAQMQAIGQHVDLLINGSEPSPSRTLAAAYAANTPTHTTLEDLIRA